MGKLIFFIASLSNGGAERVVSVLSGEMLRYFENVEIITFYNRDIFYQLDPQVKVISLEEKTRTTGIVANCKYLRKYLVETEPSAIISFMAPFNILVLLSVPHRRKFPVIVADRSDPRYECRSFTRKFLRYFLYSYEADRIVLQSLNNSRFYSKRVQQKMDVIFNPTTVGDEKLGIALHSEKEKIVVQVARLDPVKNQRMLMQSFKQIHKIHPDYKLVIYGDGPLKDELQDYIKELNMEDCIKLPGRITNVIEKMKSAEMFVLSSDFEGMSNSMLEAMCIGLPVISTKVSGAVDLIRDDENGLLVPCNNEERMTAAILSLIEDKERNKRIAENASYVINLLDVDVVVNKWMETINKSIRK